ncbi:hypothetical protein VTK26DRAFT_9316 [Humicola hyalothermophila]
MRSLAAAVSRGLGRRHIVVAALVIGAVVLYAWIDLTYSLPWNPDRPSPMTFPAAPLAGACDEVERLPENETTKPPNNDPIPNIVHYIWLLANPTVLTLDFRAFLSVYSSHLFFRPDKIYFHTDAKPEVWERAKSSGSAWTRRVLNIPNLEPNFIENPRLTSKGVDIDTFGAKSDFIRADALRKFGGIYLDIDAIPIRDVAPLRHAGFANVVGGAVALAPKHTGYVNTGVWLARPHSALAEIFYEAMDAFYNGVWAISVQILTDLAYRLHAIPGEVLIVNPRAFAPFSWELADQELLLKPYGKAPDGVSGGALLSGDAAPKELKNTCKDALAWLAERELGSPKESWEADFSATYVLHAFDDEGNKIPGWDGKITLKYILARQSNYARAVYPAVEHAIRANIIPVEETV